MSVLDRFAGLSKILAAVVALLLVGALLLALGSRDGKHYLTVDFPQTNSLYEGSDVKILGVAVGRVENLTPRGSVVRARLSYEGDVTLPDDVKAVIVSPAIVGDRFVQLAPAYGGGTALKDNAFLPVSRTAVPVELDTIYQSLDDLSVALGPDGANKDGALSRLVDDSAAQLQGQGQQLNLTIRNFGKLSTTLSNNRDELFGSLQEVRDFVQLLNANDTAVRSFNDSTARVSTVLAGERQDLEKALQQLSLALVDVNKLVKDNRGELRANVKNLRTLSQVLAQRKDELEEITVNAPTALVNVALAYNPKSGTLDTRADLGALLTGLLGDAAGDPVGLLCGLLGESDPTGAVCPTLQGLLDNLPDLGLPLGSASDAAPDASAVPGVPGLPDLPGLGRSAASSGRPAASVADMLAVK
jgi:virulence factor Mce-like protein